MTDCRRHSEARAKRRQRRHGAVRIFDFEFAHHRTALCRFAARGFRTDVTIRGVTRPTRRSRFAQSSVRSSARPSRSNSSSISAGVMISGGQMRHRVAGTARADQPLLLGEAHAARRRRLLRIERALGLSCRRPVRRRRRDRGRAPRRPADARRAGSDAPGTAGSSRRPSRQIAVARRRSPAS